MKSNNILLFALVLATFTSCKKDDTEVKTYNGPSVQIGNGTAHTFIVRDQNQKPTTIGIRMSADALNGLPSEGDPNMGGEVPGYMLSLPAEANISGYNHSEVDWNPHGHEPVFAYGVPHFDFHFYLITPEEQSQVVPGPDTVTVDPKYIPQNYISGVMAVPNMGTHWVDTTSAEFLGQPFTSTFIYGFYHGNMTFLEPMITKEFLETKPDVILPIKQPQAFQKHGYYPAQLHLYFDNQQQEYVIALEGLKYQ
jgi:hypothetical protein